MVTLRSNAETALTKDAIGLVAPFGHVYLSIRHNRLLKTNCDVSENSHIALRLFYRHEQRNIKRRI